MKCCIYRIVNTLTNKSYIGLTTRGIEKRWKAHKNKSKYLKLPLYNSMNKYGINNFKIEIVESVENISFDSLCSKEVEYIKKYNSFYPNGYNMTLGGEGTVGVSMSEETKRKMSESHKGVKMPPFTEEHKKRIGIASSKKRMSEEAKKKHSERFSGSGNPMFGRKQTEEAKFKIRETRNNTSEPFFLESPTGEIHQVKNMSLFCDKNNLTLTHVCRLKKRQSKTHKGWKLYDKN